MQWCHFCAPIARACSDTLIACACVQELEKHEMKLSFLMATQWRVGQKSPVRHLLLNGIFDPQVFRQIFTFVESRIDAYNRDFGT